MRHCDGSVAILRRAFLTLIQALVVSKVDYCNSVLAGVSDTLLRRLQSVLNVGRDLLPYQVASRSIQPFGHNRRGPKIGGCCTLFIGEAGSPSNTVLPGPRPTSLPSGVLIHPAVWPQQIWTENWGPCPFFFGGGSWVPI